MYEVVIHPWKQLSDSNTYGKVTFRENRRSKKMSIYDPEPFCHKVLSLNFCSTVKKNIFKPTPFEEKIKLIISKPSYSPFYDFSMSINDPAHDFQRKLTDIFVPQGPPQFYTQSVSIRFSKILLQLGSGSLFVP